MKESILKFITIWLIVGCAWFGLNQTGQTIAHFSDLEISVENSYSAGTLGFDLNSIEDFNPVVIPTESTIRNIGVINNGSLNFQYKIKADNFSGELCDDLILTANLDSAPVYIGDLIDFDYFVGNFADLENWEFILSVGESAHQNSNCSFDFIFYGWQNNFAESSGFSDEQIINNNVESGSWGDDLYLVVNEVYYDVASGGNYGSEGSNEWIELYNPTDSEINITNWKICDNNSCDVLPQSVIPAHEFAVIVAQVGTWQYWPDIREDAVKITLNNNIGGGLRNTGDRIVLRDFEDNEIDAMSWGDDTFAFDPSCQESGDGKSLARKVKGVDTGFAGDWEILEDPNPGTNPHSNGHVVLEQVQDDDIILEEIEERRDALNASGGIKIEIKNIKIIKQIIKPVAQTRTIRTSMRNADYVSVETSHGAFGDEFVGEEEKVKESEEGIFLSEELYDELDKIIEEEVAEEPEEKRDALNASGDEDLSDEKSDEKNDEQEKTDEEILTEEVINKIEPMKIIIGASISLNDDLPMVDGIQAP